MLNLMMKRKPTTRQKSCYFCDRNISHVDYKDPHLQEFLTEKGKIVSRRLSGLCARHQRRLARAIKTAQTLALLAQRAS